MADRKSLANVPIPPKTLPTSMLIPAISIMLLLAVSPPDILHGGHAGKSGQ
jgi:hypothetical protein